MNVDSIPQPSLRLQLPPFQTNAWQQWLPAQLASIPAGPIDLDTCDWSLTCRDFASILEVFECTGHELQLVTSHCQQTLISAAALGLKSRQALESADYRDPPMSHGIEKSQNLSIHQGTLRSGDHLETHGHLLVVGDVNPGGSVSADGDVYIWGRLRGRAHAGRNGDQSARIVALQLRPLQLRIADLVARGPEDTPQEGLAEQACVRDGAITIEAAKAPFSTLQPSRLQKDVIG